MSNPNFATNFFTSLQKLIANFGYKSVSDAMSVLIHYQNSIQEEYYEQTFQRLNKYYLKNKGRPPDLKTQKLLTDFERLKQGGQHE